MRYFLDTEFNEQGGELISLALVSEIGVEFYAEFKFAAEWKPWVAEHVKPKLTGPTLSHKQAQLALQSYFHADQHPTIICDWPTDILHLCSLLDLGEGRRISPRDWTFELSGQFDTKPLIPHHALSDAHALRKAWEKRKTVYVFGDDEDNG